MVVLTCERVIYHKSETKLANARNQFLGVNVKFRLSKRYDYI